MSDQQGSITLLDSEILLVIGHYTKDIAEMAFRLDYGKEFEKRSERLQVLQDWFQKSLQTRQELEKEQ